MMALVFAGSVKFIDYEYAGYNYQAYDIGNHFNEFAGTCGLPSINALVDGLANPFCLFVCFFLVLFSQA